MHSKDDVKKRSKSLLHLKESGLFSLFRNAGKVSNEIPAYAYSVGDTYYLLTVTGNSFSIFDVESLNLVFSSAPLPFKIEQVIGDDLFTFAVCNNSIYSFKRSQLSCSHHFKKNEIISDIIFTSASTSTARKLIVLLQTCIITLEFENESIKVSKKIPLSDKSGKSTSISHIPTMVNKVIVAFDSGCLEIWNISTGKLVYSFPKSKFSIKFIKPTPALDVISVVFSNNSIVFVNTSTAKHLFSIQSVKEITDIDFGAERFLVLSHVEGFLSLWDLEKRQPVHIWHGHDDTVGSVNFVYDQKMLVSTSCDNSIKVWIYESDSVRLLKQRTGPSSPINCLDFFSRHSLLCAVMDGSFFHISLMKDSQNRKISSSSVNGDVIQSISIFEKNNLKWDNAITCYKDSSKVTTWRIDHCKKGSHQLFASDNSVINVSCFSSCGNFALIATRSGNIEIFNIQSGHLKRSFLKLHSSPIVALSMDPCNRFICSIDESGFLLISDFKNGESIRKKVLNVHIESCCFNSESDLLSLYDSDKKQLLIVELDNMNLARIFNCTEVINSMCFSSDSKWVVCISDTKIYTYDLSSGILLDEVICDFSPSAISFSPSLDVLAIGLKGESSINLYSNTSLFKRLINSAEGKTMTFSTQTNEKIFTFYVQSQNINLLIGSLEKTSISQSDTTMLPFYVDSILDTTKNPKKQQIVTGIRKEETLFEFLNVPYDQVQMDIFWKKVKSCSSSALDLEIRSLVDLQASNLLPIINFFKCLLDLSKLRQNYNFILYLYNIAIKLHCNVILSKSNEFGSLLQDILNYTEKQWMQLEELFHKSLCLNSYFIELL